MRNAIARTLAVAAAMLTLAGVAQAQGRGEGRGADNGRHVPPGLAKKPGEMPPGQAKRYTAGEASDVLRNLLHERGYTVTRVVTAPHDVRYVYYRAARGREQRAIVRPGTDRPTFTNVPSPLMRELLTRLR